MTILKLSKTYLPKAVVLCNDPVIVSPKNLAFAQQARHANRYNNGRFCLILLRLCLSLRKRADFEHPLFLGPNSQLIWIADQ